MPVMSTASLAIVERIVLSDVKTKGGGGGAPGGPGGGAGGAAGAVSGSPSRRYCDVPAPALARRSRSRTCDPVRPPRVREIRPPKERHRSGERFRYFHPRSRLLLVGISAISLRHEPLDLLRHDAAPLVAIQSDACLVLTGLLDRRILDVELVVALQRLGAAVWRWVPLHLHLENGRELREDLGALQCTWVERYVRYARNQQLSERGSGVV